MSVKTIESDNINIEYVITESMFDKDIGTTVRFSFHIRSVEVYAEALEDWLNVTGVENEKLSKEVMRRIEDNEAKGFNE